MIRFGALDATSVAESIPWPWYAGAVAIGAALIAWMVKLAWRPLIQAQSGQWVPRSTVDLLIKAKDEEVARKDADFKSFRERAAQDTRDIRAEFITEIASIRERNDTYMRAMAENHAREIEGVRRDLNDWRGAYHLASEVSKATEAQLDEIVENSRLQLAIMQALAPHREVNNVVRELPRSDVE